MEILTAMTERRAVKMYQDDYTLPEGDLNILLEAAMLSPTSFNIQHWRVLRVTDRSLRQKMRLAAFDQPQVSDASELWVICGDIQAWQKDPHRYLPEVDPEMADRMIEMVTQFYQGKDQLQRDEAIRSGAFMAQNIMLAAKSLGLDTSPMIGFDPDQVGEIINLPDDHTIVMLLAIGKAKSPAHPRGAKLSREEIVIENRFA